MLAEEPEARVVMLTSFSDRDAIIDALDAGAIGYLLKDAEPEEIYAASGPRRAASRRSTRRPRHGLIAARATRRAGRRADRPRARGAGASRRGAPNKLIARSLGISEKTVKAHVTRIFQRIGVTDRTQAALWAQRHDIGPGA